MTYDYLERKIVLILERDLEPWVCMNALGHLCIGLGAWNGPELMGREYLLDASCIAHRGIAKYGLIVKQADQKTLRETIAMAREQKELRICDYPVQMLETKHDDELHERMQFVSEGDIRYLAAVVYGPTLLVDRLTRRLQLWKPNSTVQ